jgi:hypothetical protein
LQFGGSAHLDQIPGREGDPQRARSIRETILGGFISLEKGPWTALAEALFLQHHDRSADATFHHSSAYVQVGHRLGEWTPYARFDVRSMERDDPFYSPESLELDRFETLAGVRYDFVDNAALKFELGSGRFEDRDPGGRISHRSFLSLAAQLAFAF